MGARSGVALKFLQWFFRAIQFACAALILGVYSYFLAALHNHNLHINSDVRAVEGISGAAVLYTLIALLLLCCLAGLTFIAFVAIVLDVAFIGAFIYVAVANRHGAGSCSGYLDTPFGKGQSGQTVDGSGGFTTLPSFHTACRLQTACLSVAIVAIFFFIFSIFTELALARHHRKEKRFGPGPANNYTSGYAAGGGFFSRLFHRNDPNAIADENILPVHTTPDQLDTNRHSYATATTAEDNLYNHNNNKFEKGYGYPTAGADAGLAARPAVGYQPPPMNYRYGDGIYDPVEAPTSFNRVEAP